MLSVKIKNLRGIKDISLDLPFEKGLIAICGENGVGKSTLFTALSKLVYRGALIKYFRNEGGEETKISFELDGRKNVWTKKINWIREDSSEDEIILNGFFEGSLIYGKRFSDADTSKLKSFFSVKRNVKNLTDAEDFIISNLGFILKNDESYYEKLKVIKSRKIASQFGFNNIPYFWERNGELISQMSMSSGEYLLISLLDFINQRIKYTEKKYIDELSLIILDEMELALHPAAQNRLTKFLKDISDRYNFCIYFATHSVQVISQLPPSSIFHLELLFNKSIQIVNPCYHSYATRSMYVPDGFDFIFLVEDILAKKIIEKCLRDRGSRKVNMLFKVIACGGWEKILELHQEFKVSGLAGYNCHMVSILDGDIESEYQKKYKNSNKYNSLVNLFLPIFSVEKYLKKNIIDDFDIDLYNAIASAFYHTRSLNDILVDYKRNYKNDNNGKKLFSLLQACSVDTGRDNNVFTERLVDLIVDHGNFSGFSSSIDNIIESKK
ncbi:MAG: AAA family ATPase [Pseudomonadales bacterium]|tara:strand:- start:515 stop:2002 length:1488 start_codon:yes stop_codon:yes gene_type:complete